MFFNKRFPPLVALTCAILQKCNIEHVRQTLFEMPLEIRDEKSCQLMLIV